MATTTTLRVLGTPLAALGLALALWSPTAASAATPISLGTAASFAVLAGSTATNTGSSTINGDVGVSPGPALTGFTTATVNGTQHSADSVAAQAQTDLTTAYDTAAGESPATPVVTELGGRTLPPGVYTSPTLGLTGTLTLDAGGDPNAVFVFQAGSTLTTASSSVVALAGRANPCNVYWQVGSSATLGTDSVFTGSVLALTSISATTGARVTGRLLARNGATTLDTDTITVPSCAAAVTPTPTGTATPTSTATARPTATASPTATATPVVVPGGTTPGTGTGTAPSAGSPAGGSSGSGPALASETGAQAGAHAAALPFTGAPVLRLAGAGAVLLAGGLLLLLSARPSRRRRA